MTGLTFRKLDSRRRWLVLALAASTALASRAAAPSDARSTGAAAYANGDFAGAVVAYQRAAAEAKRTGDVGGEVDALVGAAAAYQAMGHVTLAIDTLDEPLTHKTHSADMAGASDAPAPTVNGPDKLDSGQTMPREPGGPTPKEAVTPGQEGTTGNGAKAAIATTAPAMPAVDHAAMGHAMHHGASAHDSALPLAEHLGDARRLFNVYRALASACMFSELASDAPGFLDKADALARQIDDNDAKASVANLRGILRGGQRGVKNNYVDSLDSFRDAIDLAHAANDAPLEARAAVNRCIAVVHNREFTRATEDTGNGLVDFTELARQRVAALPDTRAKAYLLLTIGWCDAEVAAAAAKSPEVAAQVGDVGAVVKRSYATLQQAKAIAEKLGDGLAQSYAFGYAGGLYEQQGQLDDALKLTHKAVFLAQQAQSPDALYRWQWQAGRILKAQGKTDEAVVAYQRAVESLRNIRNDISLAYGNPNMKSSFREVAGPIYFDLADLLIKRAGVSRNAQDLVAARDVVEQLKTAELEDYFQDKCSNLYREQQRKIEDVAKANHAAIIYYVPLVDRLEILVMLPDGIHQVSSDIGSAQLTKLAQDLQYKLQEKDAALYAEPAKEAYRKLFGPVEPLLSPFVGQGKGEDRVETLVFVPDGALRQIPMGALMPDDDHFLIERYPVAVSPGLQLMPPQPIPRKNIAVLENGLAEDRVVNGVPYKKLDQVPVELAEIQKLYNVPDQDRLQNQAFTLGNLNARFNDEQYSIVHIATHGEFGETGQQTFLVTHDGKLDLMRLERLIEPSKFRGRPVELLALSACNTASGASDRAALGLAGVAVKAGARSAMATLWSVDDRATSELIGAFYAGLQKERDTNKGKQPITKAEALRQAQLKLIGDGDHRHPYYWAPYLIIGNWL